MTSSASAASTRRRRAGVSDGVVELRQQPAEPEVRGEHRASRRLGRVRGQHELEREAARGSFELGAVDVRLHEPGDRLRERLARDALLVLVLHVVGAGGGAARRG